MGEARRRAQIRARETAARAAGVVKAPAAIPEQLPDDVADCHRLILELVAQLRREQTLSAGLQQQLARLLKARFGPRADRLVPGQLLLCDLEALLKSETPAAPPAAPKGEPGQKRNGGGRRPLPAQLERVDMVHEVPEEERRCQPCGVEKKLIGEDISEQLEFRPGSLIVIRHRRRKYACPCCQEGVVTADKPFQPIEKGIPGPGLLAHVAVSKYCDHLPLNRLEGIFARQGVEISRQTMCGWMAGAAEALVPLYEREKAEVLRGRVIQTDDTPVPVLDPEYLKRTKTGHVWTYHGDPRHPYDVYEYTPTRCRDGPLKFLNGYNGYLQADAYAGYDAIFRERPAVKEVGCWAHARRKFTEAQSVDPLRASQAVVQIRKLYAIEKEIKGLSAAERRNIRQVRSLPVLAEIQSWLEREKIQVLPKSPVGDAIGYAINNWQALLRYCEDGDLEIDNNNAERDLRGVAVGRKNWLFAGSDQGGRTAATIITILMSAKRHGLNVFAYLTDVLARMPGHPANRIDEFLPDRWKALHVAPPVAAPAR